MKRKIYTLTEMCTLVPEMGRVMSEKISPDNTLNMLSLVDEWAAKNGCKLFQILTPGIGIPVMFVFDIVQNVHIEKVREAIDELRKESNA